MNLVNLNKLFEKSGQFLLLALLFPGYISATWAATSIAAVGDSITAGWPETKCGQAKQAYGGYAKYLEPLLDNGGWASTIYNYGISGDLARYTTSVYSGECSHLNWPHNVLSVQSTQAIRSNQIPVALARTPKPEYMLYLFGTNDLGGIAPSTVLARIQAGVNAILAAGVTPIVGTILPDTRAGKEDFKDIKGTNALLRSWLNEQEIPMAELYYASSNWASLMSDGLHPNNSGRQVMANTWYAVLLEEKAIKNAKIGGSMSAVNLLLLLSD